MKRLSRLTGLTVVALGLIVSGCSATPATRSPSQSGGVGHGSKRAAPSNLGPSKAYLVDNQQRGRMESTVLIPLDLATSRLGRRIDVPAGGQVSIAPGGKVALLVDDLGGRVYPINLTNGRVGHPIALGHGPGAVAFSPDGSTAYVADLTAHPCVGMACSVNGDLITPIDLRTNLVEAPIRTCRGPEQLTMEASRRKLWVACYFGGVDVISTATRRVTRHYAVPGSPGNIAFADNGRTVIVGQISVEDLQTPANWIVLIDPKTRSVSRPIRVGSPGGPSVAAVTPQGLVYISAWGRTVPGGDDTTAFAPLNLLTRRLGRFLRVPKSREPVGVLGYWRGLGVRFLTYPNPATGDVWEGAPGAKVARLIHSRLLRFTPGMGFAQILGLDQYSPYAVVAARLSRRSTAVGVIDMATGTMTRPIELTLRIFPSVEFVPAKSNNSGH